MDLFKSKKTFAMHLFIRSFLYKWVACLKSLNVLIIINLILLSPQIFSQVGINTDGSEPDASAGLDVDFNDKGLLPPRLSTAQRDAIDSPAAGLFIYNTDMNCLQFFNGSNWSGCLAEVETNDLVCSSISVSGNYVVGSSLTANEFVTVDVDVKIPEVYNISTEVLNGYSFSATGTFTSTGVQQVTLVGSGTPLNAQSDNFIVSIDGSSGYCQADVAISAYHTSCLSLLNAGNYDDGLYWIDPDGGEGIDPFVCYCDMSTDGGGWTRVAYTEDLSHDSHFSPPDSWRWLASDFNFDLTNSQINALRSISTEAKQDLTISCQGVIVYAYNTNVYTFSFGYRYHTGFETAFGQQTYPNTNITINTDACMNNDNVIRTTTMSIYDLRLPVTNFYSRDTGDPGELFGSPLTNEPAWFR